MSDTKTRLKLTRCYVSSSGTRSIDDSKVFTVMLNPTDFTYESSISYNTARTFGQLGSTKKFSAINPAAVKFSIVLDATGVAEAATSDSKSHDVVNQLKALCSVVYDYVGERHEPSQIQLIWGTFIFYGRLESMSTKYVLFKPSGEPLRGNVDLRIVGAMTKKEEELAANRSSPDLTHRVLVKAGDTLPLLCESIYGDPAYYVDVARVNDLDVFRKLEPGLQLHFPPLA
jgi:hypothetical protein